MIRGDIYLRFFPLIQFVNIIQNIVSLFFMLEIGAIKMRTKTQY